MILTFTYLLHRLFLMFSSAVSSFLLFSLSHEPAWLNCVWWPLESHALKMARLSHFSDPQEYVGMSWPWEKVGAMS